MKFCRECGRPLTDEEAHYYENRCEGCEQDWFEAIEDWRHGRAENPEFDRLYGAEEKGEVVH